MAACRICLEEEGELVAPCACRGSAQMVHIHCLKEWCTTKKQYTECDLCHQRFVGPALLALARLRCEAEDFGMAARADLAQALDANGDAAKAARLFKELWDESKAARGSEHPDSLSLASNLARCWHGAGEHGAAADLFRRTVASFKRVKGPEHAHTLTALSNLALLLSDTGQDAEALQRLEEVYAGKRRALGEEHAEALLAANNVAAACCKAGRHDRAQEVYRESLPTLRRVLGEEHPDALQAATNLAVSMTYVGRLREALDLERQTLASKRRVLGDAHPQTRKSDEVVRRLSAALSDGARAAAAGSAAPAPAKAVADSQSPPSRRRRTGVAAHAEGGARFPERGGAAEAAGAAAATRKEGKRPRQGGCSDEVFAFLLQAGVPLDSATGYLPKLLDDGFDCLAALGTLLRGDLERFGIEQEHRALILEGQRALAG